MFFAQVIVQGLRESGVFTSVISSANTNLEKDKFLSAIGSSNSTSPNDVDTASRKIGKTTESQATARKVLEVTDLAIHEAAVPPSSPPGADDVMHES